MKVSMMNCFLVIQDFQTGCLIPLNKISISAHKGWFATFLQDSNTGMSVCTQGCFARQEHMSEFRTVFLDKNTGMSVCTRDCFATHTRVPACPQD